MLLFAYSMNISKQSEISSDCLLSFKSHFDKVSIFCTVYILIMLLNFYSVEDVVIHEFASLCLTHMAVEYNSKVQIFEQGGLEPLIRLLSSHDPDVKKNSIECIYSMVQVMIFFPLLITKKYTLSFQLIFIL